MKTPEEILDEIAAENMINIQQMVTTKQLAILAMRKYAKIYHESEVKNLTMHVVSNSVCPLCSTKMHSVTLTHYKCKKCNQYFTN